MSQVFLCMFSSPSVSASLANKAFSFWRALCPALWMQLFLETLGPWASFLWAHVTEAMRVLPPGKQWGLLGAAGNKAGGVLQSSEISTTAIGSHMSLTGPDAVKAASVSRGYLSLSPYDWSPAVAGPGGRLRGQVCVTRSVWVVF